MMRITPCRLLLANAKPEQGRPLGWRAGGGPGGAGLSIYREGPHENVFHGHQAVDMYFYDEESFRTFVGGR